MSLRRVVSLVAGLCLLAGCATTHSPTALDNWKTRRDAWLREAVAGESEVRMYNEEVGLLDREFAQLRQHHDWPVFERFLRRWTDTYNEQGAEAAGLLFQRLTDAELAMVRKVSPLADRADALKVRKSHLTTKRESLLAEYYRLDSDLKLFVAEQQEAAANDRRFSEGLQVLGLSMLMMGQSFQQTAPPLSPPLPPINCTTQYIGKFAYTNCR